MTNHLIRRATNADASDISNLYKEVWSEYADRFPTELLQARCPSSEGVIDWMKDDTYFVAEYDSEIVGVVGCSFRHGTCSLIHLAVAKNHRKQGIGRDLVETVIHIAREKQATKVWLDTVPFLKDAISLYERYGFKKCGHLRKHLWNLDIELYDLVFE